MTYHIVDIRQVSVDKFFLPTRRIYSVFSGAGKFCLAHGLGQLIAMLKVTSEL